MNKKISFKFFVPVILMLSFFTPNTFSFTLDSFLKIFKEEPVKLRVANHTNNRSKQPPTRVKIGVYVLHVGKYDLQGATIRTDFYLIFRCSTVCNNINFEIMNASTSSNQLVAKQNDYLIYRVQAEINKASNLRNYPFDSHVIDIIVENRQLTSDKMIFEIDKNLTALDSELNVVGFEILPAWTAQVSKHYYKIFNQEFSSYKFKIYIQRPWLAGLLKAIIPALIIICCNFLALFMKIANSSQRLGIATATLIAAEVFHLNVTSSLPPLGYVTYADMFMLLNYLFLLAVLVEVVSTTYFVETKHGKLAERVNYIFAWMLPICWVIAQALNWVFFSPFNVAANAK